MTLTIRRLSGIALAAILLLAPAIASAQDSRSATSVLELVKMLETMKLDAFAVKGSSPNEYVGALYFPGTQLLVVSAKFDTPWRADSLLTMKNYRDLYIELNSASQPNTKVFVLGIFPFREDFNTQRGKALQVNQALYHLADERNIFFLDIGHLLIQPNGKISKEIMRDFLHPTAEGYRIWAEAIEPKLRELMSK